MKKPNHPVLVSEAVVTEDHNLQGLNTRNSLSQSSGGWKSKARCQHGHSLWSSLAVIFVAPHVVEVSA